MQDRSVFLKLCAICAGFLMLGTGCFDPTGGAADDKPAADAQPAANPCAPAADGRPDLPPPPPGWKPTPPKQIPDTGDSLVGNMAPLRDFKMNRLDGGELTLNDLKGKPVLISFWASWCGPCRREMPELDKLYKEYTGKQFTVVGVNVDRETSKASSWLQQNPVTFPIALDPDSEMLGAYNVASMPTSFFLDKRGVVQRKFSGFKEEHIDEMKELLASM